MKNSKTKNMVLVALFAALIAICSWISIPSAVPFTLQTMAVFLAVGLLGGKMGSLTVLFFILLGAVGLPVFAGFLGGIGALLGTTGGYIIGFLFSALLMWAMEKWTSRNKWMLLLSMVLGLLGEGHGGGDGDPGTDGNQGCKQGNQDHTFGFGIFHS